MTDPFKNQRYSSNFLKAGSEFEYTKSVSFDQVTPLNAESRQDSTYRQNAPSLNTPPSRSSTNDNSNDQLRNVQQEFIDKNMSSNREAVTQLKNKIELVFKGAKIFGQFSLYPLKVLRWQCQIHNESSKYHLTPFTLMPVFYNLGVHGNLNLWKGCFSMVAYDGIKSVLESVTGEIFSFEKEISEVNNTKKIYGHLALKFIVSAITTPVFSAVIYESVQSGIAHESMGLMELLREAGRRVTGYRYNYRTRLIPFWSLILPTSVYFVSFHFLSAFFERSAHLFYAAYKNLFKDQKRVEVVDQVEEEVINEPYMSVIFQFLSRFGAITVLYPIETILNRLIVQGTRTIIDNTDNGYGVIPINTRYDGFLDCANCIHDTEGIAGFYKGIGTVFFDAALHYFIFKIAKTIALRIYDSEWTTTVDRENVKNLMSSSPNNI